jgi:hypothetical protein
MVGFLPGRVFSGRLILVGFLRSAYYGRLITVGLLIYTVLITICHESPIGK